MLRSHRKAVASTKSKAKARNDGVIEPDTRIVFVVLAIGMLVGALLTTPSKTPAKLQSPMTSNSTSQK